MTRQTILTATLFAFAAALPLSAQDPVPVAIDTAYVPGEYRVFTGTGERADLDDVVAAMAGHDVVFIGETHDDPTGHMLEAELLRRAWETYGAARASAAGDGRRRTVALSLEFFQRDVQPIVDEYIAGLISETVFRADSRPWPRYATDYRPLIEFAKEHGVEVIASNAPRRYTSRVTMHGRESLDALSPVAKQSLPPLPYGQPSAEYRDQWIEVISRVMSQEGMKCGVPVAQAAAPSGAHDNMGNQLHSQTLWDASMAYWISQHLTSNPGALVLHMVGSFHVARGTGTPEHLAAYSPGSRAMIVMLRPVADVDTFERAPAGEWGNFVIQTDESRTLEAIECRAFNTASDAR